MVSGIVRGLMLIHRLENVRDLQMVLEGARREWLIHGFIRVVAGVCDLPELRQPLKKFKITFSDLHWPHTMLFWSDADRQCTLRVCNKTFFASGLVNDAALWVPYCAVEAVEIIDVHIDRTVLPFLPLFGPNSMHIVRRLVLRRVHLVVDAGVRLTWAAVWEGAREHWSQLIELDIEDCGYTRRLEADNGDAKCVPAEHVSAAVLEEDEASFRRLQISVRSRREVLG
jgi:hypothetical protein